MADHQFFGAILDRLVQHRVPSDALFPFSYQEWRPAYKQAGVALKLQQVGPPTLYSLRHNGPSLDVSMGRRSMEGVQQRGNWALPTSMRRYQKSGRLTEQLMQLPPAQRSAAVNCAERIGGIMSGPFLS